MEIKEKSISKEDDGPLPKIIGLTGGIGSGKSSVARLLEEFDYPVYYSDDRAKCIVEETESVKNQIIQLLGDESYQNGHYNKSFVAEKVFNNHDLLTQLNSIIHPAVKDDFDNWFENEKIINFEE